MEHQRAVWRLDREMNDLKNQIKAHCQNNHERMYQICGRSANVKEEKSPAARLFKETIHLKEENVSLETVRQSLRESQSAGFKDPHEFQTELGCDVCSNPRHDLIEAAYKKIDE